MKGDNEPYNKSSQSVKFCQRSSDHLIDGSAYDDACIVWQRLSNGYRIVDLGRNRFEDTLTLVKEDFFASEPMCRATSLLKDKASVDTYFDLISAWMDEMRSVCAIHEGTGKLVGIAVATVNSKADLSKDSSRIRMNRGEALFKILTLRSCVFGNARLYEKYEINDYFRLHVLCVDSAFRNRGIGTALVRSCVDYYRCLQLPACIGAFSSGAAQTIANRLGFEILADIPYREYVTPGKTDKPFFDPGPGNYSVACMGFRTPIPAALSALPGSSVTSITTSSKKKKKTKKTREN